MFENSWRQENQKSCPPFNTHITNFVFTESYNSRIANSNLTPKNLKKGQLRKSILKQRKVISKQRVMKEMNGDCGDEPRCVTIDKFLVAKDSVY